jgi:replicative DNA helicase
VIAKQRNGPTGKCVLGWMPERATFVPLVKEVTR